MRKFLSCLLMACFAASTMTPAFAAEDGTSLTIYNGGFAAVREHIPLDLQSGVNPVTFAGATTTLEPESVILRDPLGQHSVQILEQSYRSYPVSQGLLLSMYEGKTIDFLVRRGQYGERE